jgi:hypothetical protein
MAPGDAFRHTRQIEGEDHSNQSVENQNANEDGDVGHRSMEFRLLVVSIRSLPFHAAVAQRTIHRIGGLTLQFIPVGELERFVPEVAGKGPAWVTEVHARRLHEVRTLAARQFLDSVWEFMSLEPAVAGYVGGDPVRESRNLGAGPQR